jgi:hypothetical protein
MHYSELIRRLETLCKCVTHHQTTQFKGKWFFYISYGCRVGDRGCEDRGAAKNLL